MMIVGTVKRLVYTGPCEEVEHRAELVAERVRQLRRARNRLAGHGATAKARKPQRGRRKRKAWR